MLPFQAENRGPGNFPLSVFLLLIMQTEICYINIKCIFVYPEKGNGHGKLPFVSRKRKMEVCFPWSANNKR
jgi:hypothetical protein